MGNRKGNVMVVGESGAGKTTTLCQIMRICRGQSDSSQLKERYSCEDGKRLAEGIRQNFNIWYPLKPEDEDQ